MENNKFLAYFLFISLTIALTTASRMLDEDPEAPVVPPEPFPTPVASTQPGVSAGTGSTPTVNSDGHTLTFFMHDILGGSNPTARAVTGIVSNPAVNGQVPFAKPNGAVLPVSNGVPQNNNNNGLINNNNLPFLTGLSGTTANVVSQNNGNNNNGFNFPVVSGDSLPSTPQQLMFGTMTVIDDELTEGHDLRSQFVGRAQGFYIASSVDGTSQTMAFTVMFQNSHYEDSLSFFGVHRTAVSESQLAIMGGTGKYVNAQGFAIVKTFPATNQHETDGIETLLEFSVYVTY
ncbi:dirigent protein 10-like [Mercurialis annua]|uniref:dirigent protein 10-like n=1 Tax=Mercurialis annua TaxID=3986 RepID=UPI00215E6A6A|nr:dirigent protein 10-like [Mercurialis annua]